MAAVKAKATRAARAEEKAKAEEAAQAEEAKAARREKRKAAAASKESRGAPTPITVNPVEAADAVSQNPPRGRKIPAPPPVVKSFGNMEDTILNAFKTGSFNVCGIGKYTKEGE